MFFKQVIVAIMVDWRVLKCFCDFVDFLLMGTSQFRNKGLQSEHKGLTKQRRKPNNVRWMKTDETCSSG